MLHSEVSSMRQCPSLYLALSLGDPRCFVSGVMVDGLGIMYTLTCNIGNVRLHHVHLNGNPDIFHGFP